MDRDRAAACVERAFALGINLIDTANVYGRGAAEELLADVLSARPRAVGLDACAANLPGMSDEQLDDIRHVARREAAPFVLIAAVADLALAATSAWHGWQLYSANDWWIWIVLALPAAVLAIVFSRGLGRTGLSSEHRRTAAVILLGVLAAANLMAVGLVLVSLAGGGSQMTGPQLLATAAVVLVVNVITFALVFWELDCGGPVERAITDKRVTPDFQFPQDENPELAHEGWGPALQDYLYIAFTNSIAFSPTDAMPLTHRAKLFMGFESVVAAVTLLIVAARAVNILDG